MGEETVAWRDRVMCPNSHSGLVVGLEDKPRSSDINPCPSHTILLTIEFCSIYKRPWDAPELHGKSPWQREITERRMGRPQTSSLNFLIVTWGPRVSGKTLVLLLSKVPASVSVHLLWPSVPAWRRRQWHPILVLLPGKSHGWRSLVGCSPWGC